MILECKSCSKKFLVPDSAITSKGRLVQCSSCGNKWTQFPVKKVSTIEPKKIKSPTKVEKENKVQKKRKVSKTKSGPSLYSKEYLEKKHGIKIGSGKFENTTDKKGHKTSSFSSFGFYSYLFIFLFFLISLLGILNLTKNILIFNFPFLENYINYLFENINIFIIMIKDLFNSY